jgi:spectinomycin phosphotransferase
MALIQQFQATIGDRAGNDPFERELVAFWQARYHAIGTIIERTGQFGRRLQLKPAEAVLCHADIHTGNLLIDAQGQLFIVDWDQPILAPKECDLMLVTMGGFAPEVRIETLFFQGYGATEIDPLVMAYYRYARVMEDLAAFAERVFSVDASDATKQDSLNWFKAQFAPGNLLEAAHPLD